LIHSQLLSRFNILAISRLCR